MNKINNTSTAGSAKNLGRLTKRLIGFSLLVAAGFVAGKSSELATPAKAQSRQQDSEGRQTFLSGAARSERVLEEISSKLSGIDSRLERIENLMKDRGGD